MAKAKKSIASSWEKSTGHKIKNPEAKPKKGKYDITVKTSLTPDELFKKAITTPIKKKGNK